MSRDGLNRLVTDNGNRWKERGSLQEITPDGTIDNGYGGGDGGGGRGAGGGGDHRLRVGDDHSDGHHHLMTSSIFLPSHRS